MAKRTNKVIISCAITGGIHVPTMSDALPITPEEIAQQSIDASQAGASILHLHAGILLLTSLQVEVCLLRLIKDFLDLLE